MNKKEIDIIMMRIDTYDVVWYLAKLMTLPADTNDDVTDRQAHRENHDTGLAHEKDEDVTTETGDCRKYIDVTKQVTNTYTCGDVKH